MSSGENQDPEIDDDRETTQKKPRFYCKSLKEVWLFLYPYLLLLWDGLSFFGFDDTKLDRLKGHPVTFFSKFTSLRWIVITFGSLIGALVILSIEIGKYGEVRRKMISLIVRDKYHYDANDAMTIMFVNYFYID